MGKPTRRRSPAARQRVPIGAPMHWLLRLLERLRAPTGVSRDDRREIERLLQMIVRDEDPRSLFWATVQHRAKDNDPRRENAAWVYLARIALGHGKPGKVLIGEVAKLSGLTDAQVDHAVRDYRSSVGEIITAWKPETVEMFAEQAAEQLRQREK